MHLDWQDPTEQKAFETTLFEKTMKSNNEITLIDRRVVVYYNNINVFFYLVGLNEENELILANALNTFCDAISQLLK